jgi:hypothetical protein
MSVSYSGRLSVMEYLLNAGADVNSVDEKVGVLCV